MAKLLTTNMICQYEVKDLRIQFSSWVGHIHASVFHLVNYSKNFLYQKKIIVTTSIWITNSTTSTNYKSLQEEKSRFC
jgi:hypothetical protein